MNIGVFFPSLSFNIIKSELIDVGINNLKDLGCNVVLAENCFDNMCGANIAGSPETRVKALQSMLNDDNIDIIMSTIGGYGSVQIIDKLDFQKISKRKKIIGFSDVTHLLFPLYDFANADVYLGPAFINFCNPYITDNTKKCFESIILDEVKEFDYVSPKGFYEDEW